MNYLAHLLLSGPDPEMMLGGWLGDFVKGPLTGARIAHLTPGIVRGIVRHRQIDVFCDAHPRVQTSIGRLGPDLRRTGGIAIDVCYDHFLARHWQRYHQTPLADYSSAVYALLERSRPSLPAAAQRFAQRAQSYRLLESYAEFSTLAEVLPRIAQRLSRPTPLGESFARLQTAYPQLEQDFELFFPELLAFAGLSGSPLSEAHPASQ